MACVDLPAFPLQILARRRPEWEREPIVVVSENRPQGVVSWVNEAAWRAGIRSGQRYAHALSLSSRLRADEVSPVEIAREVAAVAEKLRAFSPDVEPAAAPGVFWLDGRGLRGLYRTARRWGDAIAEGVRALGLRGAVVVGFSRFGTFALARVLGSGIEIVKDATHERARVRRVRLERLELPPPVRDALAMLGVHTVGELVRLPADGLRERFGEEVYRVHRLATGAVWDPLRPEAPPDPAERRLLLDDPEEDVERFLFGVKHELDRILAALAERKRAVAAFTVELRFQKTGGEAAPPARHRLRPAEPSLDARVLLRLLALRLQARPPSAGVIELRISVEEVPATREQLLLVAKKPPRDLRAAEDAFARIRAELGDDAVVKATLREGHLPEASYAWAPLARLERPRPRAIEARPLVRRVYEKPILLAPAVRTMHDDGWLLVGPVGGSVVRVLGPYVVSGAWWGGGGEVYREYSFIETQRGDCFWIYYDRQRRRWFVQGKVE